LKASKIIIIFLIESESSSYISQNQSDEKIEKAKNAFSEGFL